jgi:hypothetical protein
MCSLIRAKPRLIYLVPFVLAAGCAREVVINLPQVDPKIVAICHFTDGQPFRIKLSVSQSVYDTAAPQVPKFEDVDLTVATNGTFLDKLVHKYTSDNHELYYESHGVVEAGKHYSMTAKVRGYPNVDASSSVPAYNGLVPIVVHQEDMKEIDLNDGRRELRIPLELTLLNAPASNPYFAFHLSDEVGVYTSLQPLVLNYIQEDDSTFFLADGRTLSLLENIPEPAVLVNANYWNDQRQSLNLVARIQYRPDELQRPLRIFVEWRTLSEEFYRYHLSIARQGSTVPLSDPDALYNNINGGYGNFSGYSTFTYTVELPIP